MEITYRPIGIIHTPYRDTEGMPIQPRGAGGVKGTVEVFEEYAPALRDIEGFSHIILLYHFHLAGDYRPVVSPYMDSGGHGLFATRAPARPNPIGISVVRLLGVEGNLLHVQNVDIVDGTPLLDIKPYVPEFDIHPVESIGWLEDNVRKLPEARDDGRFRAGHS